MAVVSSSDMAQNLSYSLSSATNVMIMVKVSGQEDLAIRLHMDI